MWTGLMLATLFALGLFFWVLLVSVKTWMELYATPITYIPTHPTFQNYVDAWTSRLTPFSTFFANSLWVSSVTMLATIVVSTLAGYALARFRFIGKNTLMLVFLATQMFPAVLLDCAAPFPVARPRADRHLPSAHLLELLLHRALHGLDAGRLLREHPARAGRERHDRRLEAVRRHAPDHRAPGGSGNRRDRHLRLRLILERTPVRDDVHLQARTCAHYRRGSSTWSGSTRSSGANWGPASSSARSPWPFSSLSFKSISSKGLTAGALKG